VVGGAEVCVTATHAQGRNGADATASAGIATRCVPWKKWRCCERGVSLRSTTSLQALMAPPSARENVFVCPSALTGNELLGIARDGASERLVVNGLRKEVAVVARCFGSAVWLKASRMPSACVIDPVCVVCTNRWFSLAKPRFTTGSFPCSLREPDRINAREVKCLYLGTALVLLYEPQSIELC
jgi:hypothetical protein